MNKVVVILLICLAVYIFYTYRNENFTNVMPIIFETNVDAQKWLDYIQKCKGTYIVHSLNGGPFIVPGTSYSVTGYDSANNIIYEYREDSDNPKYKIKDEIILDKGYDLVVASPETLQTLDMNTCTKTCPRPSNLSNYDGK